MFKIKFFLVSWIKEYRLYKYSRENKCIFGENFNFTGPLSNLKIGKNTTINGYGNFRFSDSKIVIGNDCLIARNVTIITKSYDLDFTDEISSKNMYSKNVDIGNGVWIGGNVIILPGVTIGNSSVIGAGSIVTKNIGINEVWAGVPAKMIRKRNINDG